MLNKYLDSATDQAGKGLCKPDLNRLFKYNKILKKELFTNQNLPIMINPSKSYLFNRTYQDIFYETTPSSVRAQNRNANYFNLNNFLPFFDYRLIEFMFKIPNYLKIQNGVTKHLLRLSMKNILPENTRTRIKKTGWNAPAHLWFVGDGTDFLLDIIRLNKRKNKYYTFDNK